MEQPYSPPGNGHYNMALWSLICGIASLVCCCCGSPLGVVAVVLGIMSINAENRAGQVERSGRTMAIIGICLGGVACLGLITSIVAKIIGLSMPFYPDSPFRFPRIPPV